MLYDFLNFFSASTPGKILNLARLRFSYFISVLLKIPVVAGYPSGISIEPTTKCNLACIECPSGQKALSRSEGNMEISLYKKIINELAPSLLYINLYFQGEPFLHPGIFEMITNAKEKRIYTIVSTNGHFLNARNSKKIVESKLDRLLVCVDGMTQDVYEKYRKKGNVRKVVAGIETLVKYKKLQKSVYPYIIIQSLITSHNQHQLHALKRFFKHLGADKVSFKTMQVSSLKKENTLIPTKGKFSRYRLSEDGNYIIKSRLPDKCWRIWSSAVITYNGIIIPCCFDKNATHVLGNAYKNSIKDIWKNAKYNEFRKSVLISRKKVGICCNCTEGLKRILYSHYIFFP
jgi:radical SAM protein with 4Fe4S-binding SPASM domain